MTQKGLFIIDRLLAMRTDLLWHGGYISIKPLFLKAFALPSWLAK